MMNAAPTKTREQAVMDVLFGALRVADAALNRNAALVLSQLGCDPVPRLLAEATRRTNRVPHRLRALAVVERIGQLSGADDWMDLSILAADPNEQIRAAAGRCLTGCPVIDS
jgi:hypothetical protein